MAKRTRQLKIKPGRMISDIVETELGPAQHVLVQNIRQLKIGEWETVRPYKNVRATGLTNLKNFIEVTDDLSGDRFLLYQDGTSLKRIDYDAVTEYASAAASTLTLPSGVTIGASAKLRFFYFRGTVRITGASVPLWYSYIDGRTYFDGDDSFTVTGWQLKKAEVTWPAGTNDVELTAAEEVPTQAFGTADANHVLFGKFFYVWDQAQYELMKAMDIQVSGTLTLYDAAEEFYIGSTAEGGTKAAQLQIRVKGSSLKSNHFNERITGVGIAFTKKQIILDEPSETYLFEKEPFFVYDILEFDEMDEISFVWEHVSWDSTKPTELEISDPANTWAGTADATFLTYESGYLGVGVTVEVGWIGSSNRVSTKVATIDFGDDSTTKAKVTFDDSLATIFGATAIKSNVFIRVTPKWIYDAANGYHTFVGLDVDNLGTNFFSFTDIPSGTTDTTPDFRHHLVINDRSFVSSREAGEEDRVRYSPVNQFDVLPAGNLIQTEVGSLDEIKALAKVNDRLVIMKGHSVTQGNFVGTTWRADTEKDKVGLHSADGFETIDTNLLFYDQDGAYLFDGVRNIPFIEKQLMQQEFKTYIDSSSLIAWNKLDNEVWFFLNGRILVYARKNQEWYVRDMGITPVAMVLDQDNRLLIATATSIVTVNHSDTADESLSFRIETAIEDVETPEFHKRLKEFILITKSTSNINVNMKDDFVSPALDKTSELSGLASWITVVKKEKWLFKQIYLIVTNKTAQTTLKTFIRQLNVKFYQWRS